MNLLSYLCTIASNSEVSLSFSLPLLLHSILCSPSLLTYLSYFSLSQVANIALSKPFLSLILHCIKTPTPSSSARQRVHSQSPTATTRSLAATLLALLIRYASYIDPPLVPSSGSGSGSSSDDHILSVLTNLLKDPSLIRTDPILRHKCIAALGELIFYISAQDDAVTVTAGAAAGAHTTASASEKTNARWIISNDVILVLTKSLSDDTDEIMRHYAAKVYSPLLFMSLSLLLLSIPHSYSSSSLRPFPILLSHFPVPPFLPLSSLSLSTLSSPLRPSRTS
jgi:hypothetical protein